MTARVSIPSNWYVLALSAAMLPAGGCTHIGGKAVEVRSLTARPPANVAVLLRVRTEAESFELQADNFTLYEDEQRLNPSLTRQLLLDQASALHHHTLLLVDNSLATDRAVRAELVSAISMFVEQVSKTQPVSVFAYDGSERLTLILEFPRQLEAGKLQPVALERLVPKDVSRNLNGAILLGARELERRLANSGKPLVAGTLVVFAAGADLAGRTQSAAVFDWLKRTEHRVLAIGYGEQSSSVESFAKHGYYDAVRLDTLSLAFEEAGHDVVDEHKRGYLLSYCSPARTGHRSLRIEVRGSGQPGELLGEVSTDFSAEGFSAGCNPRLLPKFIKTNLR
jgi:hypothetical protein